jgi:hypothetical protein
MEAHQILETNDLQLQPVLLDPKPFVLFFRLVVSLCIIAKRMLKNKKELKTER